jgi:YbgC/YbaW family acyl-CoA thioester hydrolase
LGAGVVRNPIDYKECVDIRFSDLDFYGHVNSKHYVDFVSTARLVFLADKMKFPVEKVVDRGISFYMTKSAINYRRPIVGLQKVTVSSHVAEVRDNKILVIPFSISSLDQKNIFADGVLEFAIVDVNTKRSTALTEWLERLFFKDVGGFAFNE